MSERPTNRRSHRGAHCEIVVVPDGRRIVLRVSGELDLAAERLLVAAAVDAGPDVVVDLSDTSFLDASGIRAIEQAARQCRRRGGSLAVLHPRPFQRQLLVRVGLEGLLAPEGLDRPTPRERSA